MTRILLLAEPSGESDELGRQLAHAGYSVHTVHMDVGPIRLPLAAVPELIVVCRRSADDAVTPLLHTLRTAGFDMPAVTVVPRVESSSPAYGVTIDAGALSSPELILVLGRLRSLIGAAPRTRGREAAAAPARPGRGPAASESSTAVLPDVDVPAGCALRTGRRRLGAGEWRRDSGI